MVALTPQDLVGLRRHVLQTERSRIRGRLDEIDVELSELETAERVWARLSGNVEQGQISESEEEASKGKPTGTPTIPEMILESLEHAMGDGVPGLMPKGMTSYIRGRWWPDAQSTQISSIAWRMVNQGRLVRDGELYRLAPRNEVAGPKPVGAEPATSITDPEPARAGVFS